MDSLVQPCLYVDPALAYVWIVAVVVVRPALGNATSSPWYRVFLAVFAVINIPLACMEIKDQVSVANEGRGCQLGGQVIGRIGRGWSWSCERRVRP